MLARVAAGDPAAARLCIAEFGPLVWSIARRMAPSTAAAEDAVQDIFIELWKQAGRYEPAAASEIEGCAALVGTPLCSEGQMHVTQDAVVPWQHDPPASGPHYPTWAAWGEHTGVVPRGNWVHNLEHGGIVLSYRCNDDCEPELQTLRDVLAARQQLRILLTKDPLLPGQERFAAIAWTWTVRL